MRRLLSVVCAIALSTVCFAQAGGSYRSLVDSLRKRPAEVPVTADPIGYQDQATYGTFKALHPPPSADVPLDSLHPLQPGWRVRIATLSSEDSARFLMQNVAAKLALPVQLRFRNDLYEVLCGNYADLAVAQQSANNAYRSGYLHAEPVTSSVILTTKTRPTIESKPVLAPDNCWQVQVAAFKSQRTADSLAGVLRTKTTEKVEILPPVAGMWRVRVGEGQTSEKAQILLNSLRDLGYPDARLTTTEKK